MKFDRKNASAEPIVRSAMFLLACSSAAVVFGSTSCVSDLAEAPGDAGPGARPIVRPCASSQDPKDHPACVRDDLAIFVSPVGSDVNPGTKARPVRTVAHSVRIARATKSRIYFCEGNYEGTIADGGPALSYFGGLDCNTWAYNGNPTKIRSTLASVALTVSDASDIAVADLEFEAANATERGGSSIGGLIVNSRVALRRTSFTAGAGQPGEDAPAHGGSFSTDPAPSGRDVNESQPNSGPTNPNPACPTSAGGAGGFSRPRTPGERGVPRYTPQRPTGATGQGGTGNCNEDGTGAGMGVAGSHSPWTAAGGSAATSHGVLTASGWSPQTGGTGGTGEPGGGGGGGSGQEINIGAGTIIRHNGASGGAGGCGGVGGPGGKGGGSSFAVVLVDSRVTIDSARFVAGAAGKGGKGGGGQIAQRGGAGGVGSTSAGGISYCSGAPGGAGGGGGGGGGGAGGLSIGILWTGTSPTINGQSVETSQSLDGITVAPGGGEGGSGGPGGKAVPGIAEASGGSDSTSIGLAGVAQAVLKIP